MDELINALNLIKNEVIHLKGCRNCEHYNYRDDKCKILGSDRSDCMDYEPEYKSFDWDEENEEDEV